MQSISVTMALTPTGSNPTDAGRLARAPVGEAARRGPGEHAMSRPGWTTIAIPTELHAEIFKHHVPGRARSVQAYLIFWGKAGSLIDRALAASSDPAQLMAAIKAAIQPSANDDEE